MPENIKEEMKSLIETMESDLSDMKENTEGKPLSDYEKGYSRGVIDTFSRSVKLIKHIESKL